MLLIEKTEAWLFKLISYIREKNYLENTMHAAVEPNLLDVVDDKSELIGQSIWREYKFVGVVVDTNEEIGTLKLDDGKSVLGDHFLCANQCVSFEGALTEKHMMRAAHNILRNGSDVLGTFVVQKMNGVPVEFKWTSPFHIESDVFGKATLEQPFWRYSGYELLSFVGVGTQYPAAIRNAHLSVIDAAATSENLTGLEILNVVNVIKKYPEWFSFYLRELEVIVASLRSGISAETKQKENLAYAKYLLSGVNIRAKAILNLKPSQPNE